ncbi:hypothetical protein CCACVL1_09515 [Corchorus capsularis]|uniref:FBD domain-containing protein n=1 Tax=Corchorus capsularis TaxID=210143 RepID=A0A1R3IVU8_COCAP|nr:hypothetical protein CCACVL1_09515 [Corchorus capsularis]
MERIVEQRKVRNGQWNNYKRLCLKEFKMYGFCGRKTDVEILAYLLDTAIMLEKILIITETAAAQTLAQQLLENHSSSLQAEIVFENH